MLQDLWTCAKPFLISRTKAYRRSRVGGKADHSSENSERDKLCKGRADDHERTPEPPDENSLPQRPDSTGAGLRCELRAKQLVLPPREYPVLGRTLDEKFATTIVVNSKPAWPAFTPQTLAIGYHGSNRMLKLLIYSDAAEQALRYLGFRPIVWCASDEVGRGAFLRPCRSRCRILLERMNALGPRWAGRTRANHPASSARSLTAASESAHWRSRNGRSGR